MKRRLLARIPGGPHNRRHGSDIADGPSLFLCSERRAPYPWSGGWTVDGGNFLKKLLLRRPYKPWRSSSAF